MSAHLPPPHLQSSLRAFVRHMALNGRWQDQTTPQIADLICRMQNLRIERPVRLSGVISGPLARHRVENRKNLPVNPDDDMKPLHERRDDEARGRHLVAARPIEAGTVIFVEKPLLCLQSMGNAHAGALTCRCCRCFVGGPDLALAVASGRVSREEAIDYWETNEVGGSNGWR